jgi:hypothetical protein
MSTADRELSELASSLAQLAELIGEAQRTT